MQEEKREKIKEKLNNIWYLKKKWIELMSLMVILEKY